MLGAVLETAPMGGTFPTQNMHVGLGAAVQGDEARVAVPQLLLRRVRGRPERDVDGGGVLAGLDPQHDARRRVLGPAIHLHDARQRRDGDAVTRRLGAEPDLEVHARHGEAAGRLRAVGLLQQCVRRGVVGVKVAAAVAVKECGIGGHG